MDKTEERLNICDFKIGNILKKKDHTGERFGHLIVLEMLYGIKGNDNRSRTYCKCKCDCGNICTKRLEYLQQNSLIASCGCKTSEYRAEHNRSNEIGMRFGRLVIESIDWNSKPSKATCKCDCGNYITTSKADVIDGTTSSCGCLQKERASKAVTKNFAGVVSASGVEIIKRDHMNGNGVWMWKCKCPLCGSIFTALPAKIISNHTTSCGCGLKSSGERIIENFLKEINVNYLSQYRLPDCKDKYTLPFDFAVLNEMNNVILLIEYDGQQHYKSIPFWGGDIGFEITKKHDKIKNFFCQENNIPLLRLSFLDDEQTIKNKITNIIYP